MTSRLRSASVGATPRRKPLGRSRAESAQSAYLEVRCGCQYFQTENLLPDRVNPLHSRPISPVAQILNTLSTGSSKLDNLDEAATTDSLLSFGRVTTTDYYAETSSLSLSRPTSPYRNNSRSGNLNSHPYEFHPISQPEKSKSGYLDAGEQEETETFLERGRKRTLSNSVRPIPHRLDHNRSQSEIRNQAEDFHVIEQINSGLLREKSRDRSPRGHPSRYLVASQRVKAESEQREFTSYEPPLLKIQKLNSSEIPQIELVPSTPQMDTSDPAVLSAHLQKFKSFTVPKRSLSEVRTPQKDLPPLDVSKPEVLSAHLQKFKSRAQSEVRLASTAPISEPITPEISKDRKDPEVLSAHLQKFKYFNEHERAQSEVKVPPKETKITDTSDPEVLSSKLQKFKYFKERAHSEQRTSDADAKNSEPMTLPRSRRHEQRTKHHHSFTSPGKPLTLDMKSLVTAKQQEPEEQPTSVSASKAINVKNPSIPPTEVKTSATTFEIKTPLIAEIKPVLTVETKSVTHVETKPLQIHEKKTQVEEPAKQFQQIFATPVKPPRESKVVPPPVPPKPEVNISETPKTATPGKSFFKGFKSLVSSKNENRNEKQEETEPELKDVKKSPEIKPKVQESFVSNAIMMDHYNISVSHPPVMRAKLTPQTSDATEKKVIEKPIFSSQRSLDKYSTSTLLQRYRPKSMSQAPSHHGSSGDVQALPKITKTVSFDYGKPLKMENGKMQTPTKGNYIEDQYHRMSPMVFPPQDSVEKTERISNVR